MLGTRFYLVYLVQYFFHVGATNIKKKAMFCTAIPPSVHIFRDSEVLLNLGLFDLLTPQH